MKYYYTYSTLQGSFTIVEESGYIVSIHQQKSDGIEKRTALLDQTHQELEEFFSGKRKEFTIPYQLKGTTFQMKVWEYLETIPYGMVCSYQDVAKGIRNEKACRAIGRACHKNPIPFIVPCHRVVGKNKQLVGYGLGVSLKMKLLEIERENRQL